MSKEKSIEGLSGWLILVGIGIVLSPLRIIALIITTYPKMFSDGSWAALTTPGSYAYNPFWPPVLLGEIVLNAGLLLAWIYLAFLFFTKKRLFPKLFIGIVIFTLAFIFVDGLAVKAILPNEPVFDFASAKEFIRCLIGALVWIPYMLFSKRVKATFTM